MKAFHGKQSIKDKSAARSAAFDEMADELLEILKGLKE